MKQARYAVFFYPVLTNGKKLYQIFLFFLVVFARLEATPDNSLMLDEQIATGFAYFNAGKWKEAEGIFKGLQASDNPYIRNFGNLGMAKLAINEKRFADAKTLLDKLEKPEEKLIPLELKQEWILTESNWYLSQGQYESCFEWLKKADRESPKTLLSTAKAYVSRAETTPYFSARLKALDLAETCLDELNRKHKTSAHSLETAQFFVTKARLLKSSTPLLQAAPYFDEAANDTTAEEKIKIQISKCEVLIQEGSLSSLELAGKLLEQISSDRPEKTLLQSEILAKKGSFSEAISLLKQNQLPSPFHEKQLFLTGTFFYEEKNYPESIIFFQELQKNYPDSSLVPEALYWTARGKEANGEPAKNYRVDYQNLYLRFPNHPLASESYFNCFTPQDYLLGEKEALKHLNAFQSKFPKSPLLLHASYYIGLDCLHDRRSYEGKWISRQNLIGAIEAFQNVETHFNELQNIQEVSHLRAIRDQAILERAKTNLKIAELSKPAKKAIYLDYAEEVFSKLQSSLEEPQSGSIYEETLYFLALTQIQSGKSEQALKTLDSLIQHYKDKNIENAYYLSSALYQKGMLKTGSEALELFSRALQAGKDYLSSDEILNMMIAKAEVYRKAGLLDDAMLQLSEVVNYSTASSLRLKAMFLRAEIYTEQGRKPLAQKQLESIALKGGDWAIKAKEQLDRHHGYE